VTVEAVVATPPGAFRSSTEDEGFAVEDASGAGLYVRTDLGTNLRVGRRVRVTGFSGQYKDHYEVEPRFAADIGFPRRTRGA
jgi:hypothetical protein